MKIVFIGDSITECGRDKADPQSLGDGYVAILREKLKNLYEDVRFEFLNRGVSHDRVADVQARIQKGRGGRASRYLRGAHRRQRRAAQVRRGAPRSTSDAVAASYEDALKQVKACGAKLIAVEPFLLDVPSKRRLRADFNTLVHIIQRHRRAVCRRLCAAGRNVQRRQPERGRGGVLRRRRASHPPRFPPDRRQHHQKDQAVFVREWKEKRSSLSSSICRTTSSAARWAHKEAQSILPAVRARIADARKEGEEVAFTRDTHGEEYLSTQEGKNLPVPHCIGGYGGARDRRGALPLRASGCSINPPSAASSSPPM